MRAIFTIILNKLMLARKDIYLLTGDLGYDYFREIKKKYPSKYINCGASEQAMMGIAVGLALEGKLPFVYSITNFLLYRPFETIRNYVNHEKIKVILVGSGRDKDYLKLGFSHWSEDARDVLKLFPNIRTHFPTEIEEMPQVMRHCLSDKLPHFISLKR